jgi:hypothetical protein
VLAVGDGVPGGDVALVDGEGAGGAGALALLLHELGEAGLVHGQPLLAGHQRGEVAGEAVGVVEEEGDLARDDPF